MVEDSVHGFRIDLRPLEQFGVQTITSNGSEYDISVCKPLPNGCGSDTRGTAICRRNLADKREVKALGKASDKLFYNGGLLTTLYTDNAESSSIAFHCDFNAGAGKPQVLTVQPRMTAFIWATAFACPTVNENYQSCILQSTDKQGHLYDLSRLTRARPDRDWVIETTDQKIPGSRLRFHVSLCRPLRRPPPGCNPHASVCVETIYSNGSVVVADAGHAVDPPTFDGGQLMLNYSNGVSCLRRGRKSSVRTVIHFQCDDDKESSGEYLQYIGRLDECGFSLLWTTEAACPIRHRPVHDECAVIDRLTGDVFNITHMKSDTFYSTGNYEFNLCGPIRNSEYCKGDNVSVCLISTDSDGNKKGTPLATSTGYLLDFAGGESLRMSYLGDSAGGRTTRVAIELVCTTALPKKKNVMEARGPLGEDHVHRINFYSSGVCPQYRNDPVSICLFIIFRLIIKN